MWVVAHYRDMLWNSITTRVPNLFHPHAIFDSIQTGLDDVGKGGHEFVMTVFVCSLSSMVL